MSIEKGKLKKEEELINKNVNDGALYEDIKMY